MELTYFQRLRRDDGAGASLYLYKPYSQKGMSGNLPAPKNFAMTRQRTPSADTSCLRTLLLKADFEEITYTEELRRDNSAENPIR